MTQQIRPSHDLQGPGTTPSGSRCRGSARDPGRRGIWRALVAASMAVLVLATAPGASTAASPRVTGIVLLDGRHDVWIGTIDTEHPTETSMPAADVLTARISHGPYAVRIRLRFGDLRAAGRQSFNFAISTPRQNVKGSVISAPGHRQGTQEFSALDGANHCRGFTHQIDYVTDFVFMRVPRSCLGRPRWVKVTQWDFLTTGPGPTQSYMDNPHDHQGFPQHGTGRLYRHAP